MNTRYVLISAALMGTLTALLSTVPVVSYVNCLICAWLWLGGIASVWMYNYFTEERLESGKAMLLGLFTGLFGAIIATLISALFSARAAPIPAESMQQLEQVFGESAKMLTNPSTTIVIALVTNLISYAIFCTIGGLLGAMIFKPKANPAP